VFAGGLLLAAGLALVPLSASALGIAFAFGIMAAAYAAVGSTPTLLGAVNRRVPSQHRGLATGIVSAGGSVGQFVVSPLTQVSIAALGWMGSLYALVLLALVALPLSRVFSGTSPAAENSSADLIDDDHGACAALIGATRNYRYWCIAAGFFVCGFHVSFLLVHMPGVIELCGAPMSTTGLWLALLGLANIAGSIISGLALKHFAMERMLMLVYALRAIGVTGFVLLPKTEGVLLGFALWMGLTYMATLPPTSGLVGKLFGTRRIGMLFGVIMLVHQFGSFLGVWLGGVVFDLSGSYDWIWRLDIVLAVAAVLIHLPLRERTRVRAPFPRAVLVAGRV
jgi:predicted MFS family arabinose efflux permease